MRARANGRAWTMAKKGDWLMAYEKFGSDNAQIASFGGGVISEDGNVLLSGNTDTETALLFGPASIREILAGVANGDFALGPQDPLATITAEDNPLPYWTFTDTSSAGAITAAIVADAGSASGNALRFTIANNTTTGKAVQITRFFPIPSSRSRALWDGLELSFAPGFTQTLTAQISAQIDFYANDQITQVIPALPVNPTLAARAATTATITMSGIAHDINIGDTVTVALTSGPSGYAALNGTYVVTAVPSATTFQYTTATSGTITSGAAAGAVTVSTKVSSTFAALPTLYADNSIQIPDYTLGGASARAATPPANAAYARAVITIETVSAVLPAPTLAARALTTATITLGFVHGLNIGDTITVALTSGPAGYAALNGTWTVTGTPTTTSFTFTTVTSGTITSGAAAGTVTEITNASTATLDINEIRLVRGMQELVINDSIDPTTNSPATIQQYNGSLDITVGDTTSGGSIPAKINMQAGTAVGSGGIIMLDVDDVWVGTNASTNGAITAANVYAETATWSPYLISEAGTSSTLNLRASSGLVTLQDSNVANGTNPRLGFYDKNGTAYANIKSGAANVIQILNGTSATDYAQLWAERIYPMNGSTASRYMYDDGTRIAFSSGIDAAGTVLCSGAMISDAISTTTQTSSAAIWVLSSGTTYSLRRNSSSARYKTNIVDVDDVVLEAARKIKPRHYESTIEDEKGATRLGFIAEEVEAAGLTHAVGYDAEGRVESLDATALIAALYARVNDLENRLSKLEK